MAEVRGDARSQRNRQNSRNAIARNCTVPRVAGRGRVGFTFENGEQSWVLGSSQGCAAALRRAGDPLALRELIASEAVLSGVEPVDRMHLLILAIRASDRGVVGQDHELLPGVIDEIISLDPLESKQLSRTRDWLLVECWPAIEEQATLDRVRGAVRAPMWKRELKTLKQAE